MLNHEIHEPRANENQSIPSEFFPKPPASRNQPFNAPLPAGHSGAGFGRALVADESSAVLAQVFHRHAQSFRPFAFDGHGFTGDRMRQAQLLGVQRDACNQRIFFPARFQAKIFFQAREPELFAAVKFISHNRQIHMAQVDADLMFTIRDGFAFDQGVTGACKILQQGDFCFCRLAVVFVHAHHAGPDRMRREPGIHFKRRFQQGATNQRHIFSLRLVATK